MARTYRVLTAPLRGGYKYLELTALQLEEYTQVRRKIKVGRAPPRRRRFWIEKPGRWVEFTYEFGMRDIRYSDRYAEYEVTLSKWVPEGDSPWMYYEGYREEAKGMMFESHGQRLIGHDWKYAPERVVELGKGGWQTTLDARDPYIRGPYWVWKAGWRSRQAKRRR